MNTFTSHLNHRNGVTVLEVLIAIFITSFGLLGVLSMFAAGRSLSATLRVQSGSLAYAAQVSMSQQIDLLKTSGYQSSTLASRCSADSDISHWTWWNVTSGTWVSTFIPPVDTNPVSPLLEEVFGSSDPIVIDPTGLFKEENQSLWDPSSRYLLNIPGLGSTIVSPRVTICNGNGNPPAWSLQTSQSLFAGVDDVDYDQPVSGSIVPSNAFVDGRRRTNSDYAVALFLLLGGPSVADPALYDGYHEIIGVFHKRQSRVAVEPPSADYTGPQGCIFVGKADGNNVCEWSLSPSGAASVPTFSGYNDGTPESVSRAARYLKPGKLLLVRRPDSLIDRWSFQRVLSCSRKGDDGDTTANPKWLLITAPAFASMKDINTVSLSQGGEPLVAIGFDGLVLVHERGDW